MTATYDDTIITEAETVAEQRAAFLADQLEAASNTIEVLQESMASVELAREDAGWRGFLAESEMQFTREGLRTSAQLCRAVSVVNPMLKRGISLRTAYIWGSGVEIAARANGKSTKNPDEQDVNTVIQAFIDGDEAKAALFGATARIRNEKTLATDGNLFTALWTNRAIGTVRPRLIPFDQITEIIKNPEDSSERWYFLRQYTTQVRESGTLTGTHRLRSETRRVLYPSIDYRPSTRPTTYAGIPIEWDAPVVEMAVNGLDTWDFGIGDSFSVVPWARAYAELLTDWAKLFKALSRFSFRQTNPTSRAARSAEQAHRTADALPAAVPPPNGQRQVGATVHLGPGQSLEAIPKSGATIDAGSGRPLAAMVAAGLDVPVTMLLGDPGVTGARATAETLDFPTELMASMRRDEWADYLRRILGYVIDMAAKAPGGPLRRRRVVRDNASGREYVELFGDTDRTIEITWPDLSEIPLKDLVAAIVEADGVDKLPEVEILKLLLKAFGVGDVDEIVEKATDADGNWLDREATAGDVAAKRFRDGDDPVKDL